MNWSFFCPSNPPIEQDHLEQADVRTAYQRWCSGITVHMDDRDGYLIPTVDDLVEWLQQDPTYLRATIGVKGWRCVEFSITAYQQLLEYQSKMKLRQHWAVGIIRMSRMATNPAVTPKKGHAMLSALTDDGVYLIEPQKHLKYRRAIPRKDVGDMIIIA